MARRLKILESHPLPQNFRKGKSLFKVLGITKGDPKARMDYVGQMYRFFDAPAVIMICIDKMLELLTYPLIDIGALFQIYLGAR